MIKGMTGFGTAQIMAHNVKVVIEIKSLNHRYCDINFYLPVGFASVENKIRQIAQKTIERGRVTIAVRITEKPAQKISLNKKVIKQYMRHAHSLKKEFRLKGEISLADIMRLPGAFRIP